MKRQEYYPSRVEAQPEWLKNFPDILPTYATTLGIANARRDAAVLDALWLAYVIGLWAFGGRAWADAITAAAAQTGTGSSAMVLPAFAAPLLPPAMAPLPATVPVAPGAQGPQGDQGAQGDQGDKGDPGDVSNQQLSDAIAGTSSNTNAVGTLDTPFADPDAESLRQKINEVILNGRR